MPDDVEAVGYFYPFSSLGRNDLRAAFLAQADALTAAVLVDEHDAGGCSAHSHFTSHLVVERPRGVSAMRGVCAKFWFVGSPCLG